MKKGKSKNNGILPNSLRIISSCIKTVSNNASSVASTVRSSVAASISASSEDHKDQVTWAGFDRLEFGPSNSKHVLLLGYQNGFQVFDVEDAANFTELISKRDGPVSFLQMQPFPASSNDQEGFKSSHPLLLVVAGDDTNSLHPIQNCSSLGATRRDGNTENLSGNCVNSPTSVRFYSLRSHCYVHILRFRSTVHVVRCSPQIVAVGLASQIYCIDALTLENKFSVLTYPVPQLGGQGTTGVNVGYGPMAVGPRWLAYACNNPLIPKTSRLSPQKCSPSPCASLSTSPGGSTLVARYAMESGKQLATGIINLGDIGYKTLSKYCQELLPDGSSSPVPSTSSWKVGRHPGSDCENAGMVAIKDFNSRAIISQFKAHTSPISALCFDPSGTLLVTASVYGNNINIFRIMPSRRENGPDVQSYDMSSSHVHLYKLHRGITSAMIQDICFSDSSQWIAVVSSKGTCHVFVLSPFGGDFGLQSLSSVSDKPSLYILSSQPWWSSSSVMINQYLSPPLPPVSLSVVSRIKYSSFGWINTINSATGSATGKVFVPSGAVAAVFHNSISQSAQVINSRVNLLAHLLVYTPSGHVVQHGLLPSIGPQLGENDLRTQSASFVHVEEEDLRVEVKPIQWWDVCRRSDWQEREECVLGKIDGNGVQVIQNKAGCEDNLRMDYLNFGENKIVKTTSVTPHDRSHWYLSNAEVQIGSGRLAVWQKSKICFYLMDSSLDGNCGGEFEIETLPAHEVEIKQKELLPVFDHFHSIRSGLNDRGVAAARHNHSPSLDQAGKGTQETVICHSMPASSTESSECGSSRRIENLLDLDQMNCEKPFKSTCQMFDDFYLERSGGIIAESPLLNRSSIQKSSPSEKHKTGDADVSDPNETGWCSTEEYLLSTGKTHGGEGESQESLSTDFNKASCALTLTSDSCGSDAEILVGGPIVQADNSADSRICFQEGHGGALGFTECCCHTTKVSANDDETTKVSANDVDNGNSHYKKEKPNEDAENDDFLGGMFSFSE